MILGGFFTFNYALK